MTVAAQRDKQGLVFAAATLARSSPREWESFLAELSKYADNVKDQCVQAPLEALHGMQGQARQCAALVALFEDAVKTADRIVTKRA